MAGATTHRVVVVGGGFGGLECVSRLAGAPVGITLIDRRNHHLFQPLLYQAATASLSASEIAWPIRHLMKDRSEVTTLMATVIGVDPEVRSVALDDGEVIPYDTLVLATGSQHAYFGNDHWEAVAPGLKTLEDATTLRRRILLAFEDAEKEEDAARRQALLTFVIVGAGPTGVELAGAIAELARTTLARDFRRIDPQAGQDRPGRSRRAGPVRICRGSLGLCPFGAGEPRRRDQARTADLGLRRRGCRLRRRAGAGAHDHLGSRNAGLAGCRMAKRSA